MHALSCFISIDSTAILYITTDAYAALAAQRVSVRTLSIPESLDFMLYIRSCQPLPRAVTLTDAYNSVANLCGSWDQQQH